MRAAKAVKDVQGVCNSLVEQLGKNLAKQVDASNVDYLRDHVFPLLLSLASVLCAEQPVDPRAFSCLWLTSHYSQPDAGAGLGGGDLAGPSGESQDLSGFAEARKRPQAPTDPAPKKPNPRQSQLHFVEEENSCDYPFLDSEKDDMDRLHGRMSVARASTDNNAAASQRESTISICRQDTDYSEAGDIMGATFSDAGMEVTTTRSGTRLSVVKSANRRSAKQKQRSVRRSTFYLNRMRTSMGMGLLLAQDARDPKGPDRGAGFAKPSPHDRAHTTEEIIEQLRFVPQFASLGSSEIDRVAKIAITRWFEPDEVIMNFAEQMSGVYVIVSGSGKVSVPQCAGQLTPGDCVGEECLRIPEASSNFNVSAGEHGLLSISVPQEAFSRLNIAPKIKHKKTPCHKTKTKVESNDVEVPEKKSNSKSAGGQLVETHMMTAVDRQMIKEALKNNRVLKDVVNLTPEQSDMIIEKMKLYTFSSGEDVVEKGGSGTSFFVVQEGHLRLPLVPMGKESYEAFRRGDSFGELALLYNEPRKQTVRATVDCKLWVLEQADFKDITQKNNKRQLEEYVKLLKHVPFLIKEIDQSLLLQLASVLEEVIFLKEDEVITEGEDKGVLFLIADGEVAIEGDDGELGNPLKRGEWIGETELLEDRVHSKSAVCISDMAKVMMLDQESFQVLSDASIQARAARLRGKESALDKWRRQANRLRTAFRLFGGLKAGQPQKEELTLKNCDVVGALGEGGFGTVLLLRDKNSKQEFALKALSKTMPEEAGPENSDMERRLLSLLSDSDFIVKLHGTFEDANYTYLVLDCAFGGELFDVYSDNDLWGSVMHSRFYIASVALGLAHMHSKRVVWRDLKLENCLVDLKGYIKLTDMGIAKRVMGKTYTVCGTADYFAPETLRQTGHNRAADWWACGVLLFIMVAGRSPFDAPESQQIYKNIIKGIGKVKFPANCAKETQDVICALCQKRPEERLPMQKGGLANLMDMPMFDGFSWTSLECMTMPAPYLPNEPDYSKIAAKMKTLTRKINFNPSDPGLKKVNDDMLDQLSGPAIEL